MSNFALIYACLLLLLGLTPGHANVIQTTKIEPAENTGNIATDSNMGAHVSVHAERAVVTLPGSGDVLVYHWVVDQWVLESAFNAFPPDDFGTVLPVIDSVAVHQDRIAVGNGQENLGNGTVRVFEKLNNEWVQTSELFSPSPENGALFGHDIVMNDSLIVVSSPKANWADVDSGVVFVFTQQNGQWQSIQQLIGQDVGAGDWFGHSMDLSAEYLVIGAPKHNYNAATTGAAYAFWYDGSQFLETEKVLGASGAANSLFGEAVAIQGNRLAVAAPNGFNEFSLRTGSVYTYQLNTGNWLFEQKVSSGAENERFGQSLDIQDDQLVVINDSGAHAFSSAMGQWTFDQWLPNDFQSPSFFGGGLLLGVPGFDDRYNNQGKVSAYTKDTLNWEFESDLDTIAGIENEQFGASVATDGNRLLVGVSQDMINTAVSGSVRMYEYHEPWWTESDTWLPADVLNTNKYGHQVWLDGLNAYISSVNENGHGQVHHWLESAGELWGENQILMATNSEPDNGFGSLIRSLGPYLFVRAETTSDFPTRAIYVFKHNGVTWDQTQVIQTGLSHDGFAEFFVVDGNQLLISYVPPRHLGSGLVKVFSLSENDQWLETDVLAMPPNLFDSERFGAAIDIGQDWLVVSSDDEESGIGGIYGFIPFLHLYERTGEGWDHLSTIESTYADGQFLKMSLSVDQHKVMLNLYQDRMESHYDRISQSRFYVIENDGLAALNAFSGPSHLTASPPDVLSAQIVNDLAVVGAPWDNINGQGSGSVLTFDLDPPDLIFASDFELVP